MKCKRPKHSLTPFRVVWLTACRFAQRPWGKYNSLGGICQISPAARGRRGTDSHASDVGHWLGMTPLRGVRADRVVRPYGGVQGVLPQNGGRGRTPPLRTNNEAR